MYGSSARSRSLASSSSRRSRTNTPKANGRSSVGDDEHAAAELRHILPRQIVEAIRWTTFRPVPGTYIDDALAEQRSDLLFAAELDSGDTVLIYTLLEHQSTDEWIMAVRLLGYMHQIWDRWYREHGKSLLPLIVPAVLCQIEGGWKSPTRFSDLFSPALGDLRGLLPDFEYAIDDLAHASDEDLRQRALADLPKLGLWIMRDVRNGEALLRALDQWGGLLEAVVRAPSGREAAMRLLRYIALVADKLHVDAFRAKLRGTAPAAEALAMTIAEQMEAKGRAEEQARAAREMLRRDREAVFAVLDARGLHVSDDARARVEASEDLDELRAWLRNAATASHAEDIFR